MDKESLFIKSLNTLPNPSPQGRGVFTTFAFLYAPKSGRETQPLPLNERAYLLPSPLRGEGKGEGVC